MASQSVIQIVEKFTDLKDMSKMLCASPFHLHSTKVLIAEWYEMDPLALPGIQMHIEAELRGWE